MDTSSLMIDDWVFVRKDGNRIAKRVACVSKNYIFCDKSCYLPFEVEGIPLTDKMLESGNLNEYILQIIKDLKLEYVHELQHIFNAVGSKLLVKLKQHR